MRVAFKMNKLLSKNRFFNKYYERKLDQETIYIILNMQKIMNND